MNTRIEEIRIQNFRAIENTRLRLEDLTFLVGRNGAGKSTIIDAVEVLREAVTDNLRNALDRRDGFAGVVRRAAVDGPLGLAVVFRAELAGHLVRVLYGFRMTAAANSIEEVLKVEGRAAQGFRRTGSDFESETLAAASLIAKPPSMHDRLVLPSLADDGLSGLALDLLQNARGYELSAPALRVAAPIHNATTLEKDGSNAADVLVDIRRRPADFDFVRGYLRAVTPSVRDVRVVTRGGRREIEFSEQCGQTLDQFAANHVSQGTLRILGLLLALKQDPRPSFLLFDEIEDSMHPLALGAVLEAIERSVPEVPVVVTSHSPEVLSFPSARPERLYLVEKRDGIASFHRLDDGVRAGMDPVTTLGDLLRTNALYPAPEPARFGGDLFDFDS